jgi:hypothetical protein
VYVATLDTASATELCVRTLHKYAGYPFHLTVGDSGSRDRSIPVLRRLESAGWLSLELAPGGRRHAEWLDHWLPLCTTRYAVFVDSDMEFLAAPWLADMVATAQREGAAMVTSRFQELRDRGFVDRDGTSVRWAPRPTPWLLLVDVPQLRPVAKVGFGFRYRDDPEHTGGRIAFDTGAFLLAKLTDAGMRCVGMPDGWTSCYRHFGGMTWIRQRSTPIGRTVKQTLKRWMIWARLQRARIVARQPASASASFDPPSDRRDNDTMPPAHGADGARTAPPSD